MAFVEPEKAIRALTVREGMRVADFGAGSGAYTFLVAERVGSRGLVIAVDIDRELLRKIKNEAQSAGLEQVEILWGDIDEPGGSNIESDSIDALILSNTLFQLEKPAEAALEIYRVLKKEGKLLLIDWSDSFKGLGPAPDAVVSKKSARELFTHAGLSVVEEFEPGAHHYGIVLEK
ncbi:hypothetical protein COU17_03435 [Candidatus Kaiserbacteria bacterium CG10_big_fil_rev_8_21_14_0_10_49_17]|uniref:Methyltransferase domain-containing protein n=1 Tax=Candidatus Kaiserbacteria bacterium CG10_big_fil_rev_8_21_14_0_10_49_17 TaxID=1974609 RepID=A0A2M6WDN1_9BACT|nr:MAG: hypothetical protein COU17_03435 [Candidatus Kaiserbacteria bacterium CG10_big_fil_rev_8_21_14_0_10_49_17]